MKYFSVLSLIKIAGGQAALAQFISAYFRASWTAFQTDRGRDFSGIVDGVSV
jgi:hypothetical protein